LDRFAEALSGGLEARSLEGLAAIDEGGIWRADGDEEDDCADGGEGGEEDDSGGTTELDGLATAVSEGVLEGTAVLLGVILIEGIKYPEITQAYAP